MDITKKRMIGFFAAVLAVLILSAICVVATSAAPPNENTGPVDTSKVKALTATSGSGIATKFWVELKPIPSAPPRLWLFVANSWVSLDNVDSITLQSVQQAFEYPKVFQTQVWYNNGKIEGLVVNTT